MSTQKVIPYTHDMAKHNSLYLRKDVHTRNAEAQESAGKNYKHTNTNGKEQDACTTLMRARAAEDALANLKPSPHSQHLKTVMGRGAVYQPVKLDPLLCSSSSSSNSGSSSSNSSDSSSSSSSSR